MQTRILDAALKVFAKVGFTGASMDQIASTAGVTKPTIYYHFPSKDALFEAMLTAPRDEMLLAFAPDPGKDLPEQLLDFAWAYAGIVMHPDYLSLARLIIGEAHRFPQIGRAYQASGPDRVLAGLMTFMSSQKTLGKLSFDDAELAAEDFWGLILSAPRNRALHVPDAKISRADLARSIHNGLGTFLRAYATDPKTDLAGLAAAIDRRGTRCL